MDERKWELMLLDISARIRRIPSPQVPLVAAILSCNDCFPPALSNRLLSELANVADLTKVSPAAEAVMRICEFNRFNNYEFGRLEVAKQFAFLRALSQDEHMLAASDFVLETMKLVMREMELFAHEQL